MCTYWYVRMYVYIIYVYKYMFKQWKNTYVYVDMYFGLL